MPALAAARVLPLIDAIAAARRHRCRQRKRRTGR
jgi:hypothetical protein